MNILFDGNYLIHKTFNVLTSYFRGEDLNVVLAKEENQQMFMRKCIIDLCAAVRRFDDVERVAFVIDSTSWRYEIHKDYKYALTRTRENWYKHFLTLIDRFEALLRKKGLIVSRVPGAEGDDLLYAWSFYFEYVLEEEVVIITGDSDIGQLASEQVSLFNNNSKKLQMSCVESKKEGWEEYFRSDEVTVNVIKPFEVLLYKTIMGDKSDNVLKVVKGFGDVAFKKMLDENPNSTPEGYFEKPVRHISDYMTFLLEKHLKKASAEFASQLRRDMFRNLELVWLNANVYNLEENRAKMFDNMLDDVNEQKNKYSYSKPYDLEHFYGMLIK